MHANLIRNFIAVLYSLIVLQKIRSLKFVQKIVRLFPTKLLLILI